MRLNFGKCAHTIVRRICRDLWSPSSFIRVHRSIHSKRAGHRRGCRWYCHSCNNFNAATAASLCAGHAQQLGGESPLLNLMEVKG